MASGMSIIIMLLPPPDLISRQSRTGRSDRGQALVSQNRSCPTVPLCPKPVRVPDSPVVSQALSLSQSVPLCPKPFRCPSQSRCVPSPFVSKSRYVPDTLCPSNSACMAS